MADAPPDDNVTPLTADLRDRYATRHLNAYMVRFDYEGFYWWFNMLAVDREDCLQKIAACKATLELIPDEDLPDYKPGA